MMPFILAAMSALIAATLGCWASRKLFRRLALIDRPGSELHKQHGHAVPYGGGPGIAIGLAAGVLVSGLLLEALRLPREFWALAGGAAGLFVLGLYDDLRPQRAGIKLAVQLAIIIAACLLGDLRINSLGPWSPLAIGGAVLWCVLITNAYNLLDHADGLTACIAIISAAVLASAALLDGDAGEARLWFALMGALGGFLIWNAPPARLYMGDAGSLALGFLIGGGCLAATFWPSGEEGTSPYAVLAPVLVTAIPLYDTGVVMVKRLLRRHPVMRGDRNHISHRLTRLGLGAKRSLACVVALQTALAASALLLRLADPGVALIVLLQSAGVLLAVILLEASRDAAV